MNKGLIVVISGPSGVGKGTIIDKFIDDPELNLVYSVSMTTRKPRNGEIDGVNYNFVSRETFEEMIANNELLEWAKFVGNYYGTSKKLVDNIINNGKNVILEIEVEGTKQIMEKCPNAVSIFVTPPNLSELKSRIEKRCTETAEIIQERLEKAKKELCLQGDYKYAVCNDNPDLAADIIKLIILRNYQMINK